MTGARLIPENTGVGQRVMYALDDFVLQSVQFAHQGNFTVACVEVDLIEGNPPFVGGSASHHYRPMRLSAAGVAKCKPGKNGDVLSKARGRYVALKRALMYVFEEHDLTHRQASTLADQFNALKIYT